MFVLHSGSRSHPERPSRIYSILKTISTIWSHLKTCELIEPKKVERHIATLTHPPRYFDVVSSLPQIDSIIWNASGNVTFYESGDMFWNKFTGRIALYAAGTVVMAVEEVIKGNYKSVFCIIRPPGHHASAELAEGFCWLNNVAIAAKSALENRQNCVNKILILDWDAHHGNGTQSLFISDPRVLFISIHRMELGFYPGSGKSSECGIGKGKGYTINIPWKDENYGDEEYYAAFESIIRPVVTEFSPDLVLVSAGFDAARGDRIGMLDVTPSCFGWMALQALEFSNYKNCVFSLEGGYNLDATSSSLAACISSVCRESHKTKIEQIGNLEQSDEILIESLQRCKFGALDSIRDTIKKQMPFWKCLEKINGVIENIINKRNNNNNNSVKFLPFTCKESCENVISNEFENISNDTENYFDGLGRTSGYFENFCRKENN